MKMSKVQDLSSVYSGNCSDAFQQINPQLITDFLKNKFILHGLLLTAVIVLFEFSSLDIFIQDFFYKPEFHCWILGRNQHLLRLLFYSGAKSLLIMFGITCVLMFGLSFTVKRIRPWRSQSLLLILSLTLIPLFINSLKAATNIYVPHKIERYGGNMPYVKLFESYPDNFCPKRRGRGWPAGHASGGFALMALYFTGSRKRTRKLGLAVGISTGWITGLYQMICGQHYLSHTIISMQIAWIIILLIRETQIYTTCFIQKRGAGADSRIYGFFKG